MRRPKQNRILGMTYLQVSVIAGLALAVSVIMGCFLVLVLFPNRPSFAPPQTRMPTPELEPLSKLALNKAEIETDLRVFFASENEPFLIMKMDPVCKLRH